MEESAEGFFDLQLQIATLNRSLAALSAQKSRMEASFKAENNQIRNELLLKDKTISELQEHIKELNKKHAVDLEATKSQVIERQEREKERNDFMVMLREMQKLYADERRLKENLEMLLNGLKRQFSSVDDSGLKCLELELTTEQHAVAFVTEQRQAHTLEERSNLAVLLEDRVARLEARLAELSTTVGTHDRHRRLDQKSIQKLKDKIDAKEKTEKSVPAIVDEIMQLKKLLIIENAKSNIPVDINKIFITDAVHKQCEKDKSELQADLDACKSENSDLLEYGEFQQNKIESLQEEVKALNQSVRDKNTLRADLTACQLENSDLKRKVENQRQNLRSLNARFNKI